MAAEISRGNETIGMERDEEWGGGRMSGEDGRVGEKEGPQRGPEGGRSSVSPPDLSFSRGSRQSRSRDARARSYMYRVDEPARIIIFLRNMELQACIVTLHFVPFTLKIRGKGRFEQRFSTRTSLRLRNCMSRSESDF